MVKNEKLQSDSIKKILLAIESDSKEMVRLKDCNSGDVCDCLFLSNIPLFIHKGSKEILLLTISLSCDRVEVRWNDLSSFRYGLNCQMWVYRKIQTVKTNQ